MTAYRLPILRLRNWYRMELTPSKLLRSRRMISARCIVRNHSPKTRHGKMRVIVRGHWYEVSTNTRFRRLASRQRIAPLRHLTRTYTFKVMWSEEDQEYAGLCDQFPSLSWLAKTEEEALYGIRMAATA
jgi:hypothetical protein